MKVFIRRFNPYINSKTGDSLPRGMKRGGSAEWIKFENLVISAFESLGCEFVEQLENPTISDDTKGASFRIYAHKTRRDIPDANLFYMQMHLSNLFLLDNMGWGADHSKMQFEPNYKNTDLEEAKSFVDQLKDELLNSGKSKHPQPNSKNIIQIVKRKYLKVAKKYPEKYILAPLQVPRDYVNIHHSNISVLDWIHLLSNWSLSAKQNIVFKIHPFNKSDFDLIDAVEKHAKSNPFVYCLSGNIHDLIDESIGVWTINSGVGFEALIHNKPVVTFGNCDYKWVSFNANKTNFSEAIEYTLNYSKEDQDLVKKFLFYYCNQHAYSIKDSDIESTKNRIREYARNILQ